MKIQRRRGRMKGKRKIPQRMCINCGEMKSKQELMRIVKNKDGEIFYDPTGKANGRGAYICTEDSCLTEAIETKKLEKVFKQPINQEIIKKLKDDILNG